MIEFSLGYFKKIFSAIILFFFGIVCELYANGKYSTFVDHLVKSLQFPFIKHPEYSFKMQFDPSTPNAVFRGECGVLGLCLIMCKWHTVVISLFINSVSLSNTRISGNGNLDI